MLRQFTGLDMNLGIKVHTERMSFSTIHWDIKNIKGPSKDI